MTSDQFYIYRCLQLALSGKGSVHPNPLVGSVIVHNNKIIGEGYHKSYGEPHAEVNAVNSVKDMALLKDSTLYVNLEPCCHWGKTPPCTQLIIDSGIKKVVIGNPDPNPVVGGKGVEILKKKGIEVLSGILEEECSRFNRRFFDLFQTRNNVRFILKWAQSRDGFIGKHHYSSLIEREISNRLSKRLVHKIRSETDAVLIGTNTALTDNPILDNRYWFGNLPTAIVIDRTLKIPLTHSLFKAKRKVLVLNEIKDEKSGNLIYCKILSGKNFWERLSLKLKEYGITSVLLEGGSQTLQSFIDADMACEIIRITSDKILGEGIKAPIINLNPDQHFFLGDNLIELYSD